MKLNNIGLILFSAGMGLSSIMATEETASVMATDAMASVVAPGEGNEGLNFLQRELGKRCKKDGKHCDIKFLKIKYKPGDHHDDEMTVKYKFTNDDSDETFKLTMKEKHGVKFKVENDRVKAVAYRYNPDTQNTGDPGSSKDSSSEDTSDGDDDDDDDDDDGVFGDDFPPKLKFDTQKDIPSKYDGEKTTAKVKGWEAGEDLVVVVYEPEDDKCSFNNAKHCEVKVKKATYEVDGHEEKCTLKYKLKNSHDPNKVYKVIFKEKYGAKIKVKHGKVKCIYKDYYGQDYGHGHGLPYDLEFHKMHIHDAYYKGHDTNGRVKSWKKGKDLILVIKKPDSPSHSMDNHGEHHDENHDDDDTHHY